VTRIDFLRHGKTEAGDRLLGRTDAPLSAEGRDAVARQIAGRAWSAIIASPLNRARESANMAGTVAMADGTPPLEIDDAWREIDFGEWDGRTHADLAADPRRADFYRDPDAHPPPQGETMDAVRARIGPALERLAARGPGPLLVVTHGGAIRMALSLLLAIPFARLWAIRIDCAARVSVDMGLDPAHGLWGEIVEVVQPSASRSPGDVA
jgi:alpha-ribazole phosphatase